MRGQAEEKGRGGVRIPPIAMVPICSLVGWVAANWAGAIFGGIIGIFLWRSRA